MIKTAVIGDKELFDLIESNYREIMDRDLDLLAVLITKSVRFKAQVVSEDERETGLRRILNFGHTYGHVVEMKESVKHGFAVASGMEFAADFSFERGLISSDDRARIISLLERFALLGDYNVPVDQVEQLILHDKKKTGAEIHFVFTQGIGKAIVEKVTVDGIIEFYERFRNKKIKL